MVAEGSLLAPFCERRSDLNGFSLAVRPCPVKNYKLHRDAFNDLIGHGEACSVAIDELTESSVHP